MPLVTTGYADHPCHHIGDGSRWSNHRQLSVNIRSDANRMVQRSSAHGFVELTSDFLI